MGNHQNSVSRVGAMGRCYTQIDRGLSREDESA